MPASIGTVLEASTDLEAPLPVSRPSLSAREVISIPRHGPLKNLCIVGILARRPREVKYFVHYLTNTGKKQREDGQAYPCSPPVQWRQARGSLKERFRPCMFIRLESVVIPLTRIIILTAIKYHSIEAPCSELQGIFDPQGVNYLF
jgi:hypothetical protein